MIISFVKRYNKHLNYLAGLYIFCIFVAEIY